MANEPTHTMDDRLGLFLELELEVCHFFFGDGGILRAVIYTA